MSAKPSRPTGKSAAPKTAKAKPTAAPSAAKAAPAKKPSATPAKKALSRCAPPRVPSRLAKNSDKFYIVVEREELNISTEKPQSSVPVDSADTFHEAKDKAVDYLIALIDNYERRLWEIKQSQDYGTLVKKPK